MNIKPITFATLCAMIAIPAYAAEQTVNLSVPSMYCASCPFIIEAAIGDLDGVLSVSADSVERTALVIFDDEALALQDILNATQNVGYEAFLIEAES